MDLQIDAYGTYARLSSMADAIERLALDGVSLTEADLADRLRDAGWRFPKHFITEGSSATDDDESDEEPSLDYSRANARAVFAIIEERSATLASHYPFRLEDGRLVPPKVNALLESPYAALLAITLCHAYRIPTTKKPTEQFEETVAETLSRHSVCAINFSGLRSGVPFSDAVTEAGRRLQLPADSTRNVRARYARDENVDSIARLVFTDSRVGAWTILGQVTCAKSDSWDAKLQEPSISLWKSYLDTAVSPHVFLAVPHHVEIDHLRFMVRAREKLVLDRLRLARMKSDTSPSERVIIESMCSTSLVFD